MLLLAAVCLSDGFLRRDLPSGHFAGEVVIEETELSQRLYIIIRGEAKVVQKGKPTRVMTTGHVFGDESFRSRRGKPAGEVTAVSAHLWCATLGKEDFRRVAVAAKLQTALAKYWMLFADSDMSPSLLTLSRSSYNQLYLAISKCADAHISKNPTTRLLSWDKNSAEKGAAAAFSAAGADGLHDGKVMAYEGFSYALVKIFDELLGSTWQTKTFLHLVTVVLNRISNVKPHDNSETGHEVRRLKPAESVASLKTELKDLRVKDGRVKEEAEANHLARATGRQAPGPLSEAEFAMIGVRHCLLKGPVCSHCLWG